MIWYVPSSVPETLKRVHRGMGGGEEGGEEEKSVQGSMRPIGAAHVLWVRIYALAKRMGCLCSVHTWWNCSWSHYAVRRSLGRMFEFEAISYHQGLESCGTYLLVC